MYFLRHANYGQCCMQFQAGEPTKYKMVLKAPKEPIHSFLVNPELEPPGVIIDFPNNYKAWLESRKSAEEGGESISDQGSQALATTVTEEVAKPAEAGGDVEDDLAAELPDGFCSTSSKLLFVYHV